MALNKPHILMLLIIMIVSIGDQPSVIQGRPLSLISHQVAGYSKILATLGVVCKCCDGGVCTSTRTESCKNLQCLPWKSH